MKNPIYVFGHRNPDTDTIVSAIAYAEYKRKQGFNAVACRLGSINSETEFLLEKFGYEDPIRIYNARQSLKDIKLDKISTVSKNITMHEAQQKILKTKTKVLFVVDSKKRLQGLITLDDLTYIWTKSDVEIENIINKIQIEDIIDVLEGELVLRGNRPLSGKMHMFPSLKSNVEDDSVVISRNEDEKIKYCLDIGASLIIVVTSSPISKSVLDMAKDADATIITTTLSPLAVTRKIYECPSIEWVMAKKEKIIYFDDDDTVEDATKKILKSRHRSYPVLDENGKIIGSLSRFHLFNYQKKQLILVDHNEYKQSIDNIEDGEILEIIDHHRFGGFKSDNPLNIITKPYGSTASIIAEMYIENKVSLSQNMAGLLLGAIISDTMNFNSPTTTKVDVDIASKLETICKINRDDLCDEMVLNSDSILTKKFVDVVYEDFKEFNIEGEKVGLAQASCKSRKEFNEIKDDLQNYLEDTCKSGRFELMIIMLTNPNGSGSFVLSAGDKRLLINDMFKIKDGFVKGLLSRKKQLLPAVIKVMGEK